MGKSLTGWDSNSRSSLGTVGGYAALTDLQNQLRGLGNRAYTGGINLGQSGNAGLDLSALHRYKRFS